MYLKYDGDPSLQLEDVNDLFHSLAAKGIRVVQGNLYVDTSRFDQQGIAPGTDPTDAAYCYGAPITAGMVDKNCVTFKVLPGRGIGQAAKFIFPYDVTIPVVNEVVTSNGRSSLSFKPADEEGEKCVLTGYVSPRRATPLTIPLPSSDEYSRAVAAKLLNQNGIGAMGGTMPTHPESQLKLIVVHESKPLSDLVLEMMRKSDNIIANALFKTVGASYNKQTATWQNSATAVKAILQQNHIDISGMQIIDGSGLSRDNRVTPDQLAQVLTAAYQDPKIAQVYMHALPVGGLNGTLKNRLGSRDIIGKVKAKTGSMHGVSSLSGYVETQSGETLVFSIIVNDFMGGLYPYRLLEDKVCRVLRANY